MPNKPTTSASIWSYQQNDGSNLTTVGVDNSFKVGDGNLTVFTGAGMTFDGKPPSAVVDLKGSVPYGETCLSGGFRVRNNLGEESQTVQFRVQPCNINLPIGKNTSFYTTPYVATKVNYQTGDTKTTTGIYGGISQKIGNVNVKLEGQLYDATRINASTTSVNIGVSIPLN